MHTKDGEPSEIDAPEPSASDDTVTHADPSEPTELSDDGAIDEPDGIASATQDLTSDETLETDETPLGDIRLDDAWREEPNRPIIEHCRLPIGITMAVALHVGIAVAGYASVVGISERIGAGGRDESSISVELITREALDAIRAREAAKDAATKLAASTAALAPVTGSDQAQRDQSEAQDGAPPTRSQPPKPASQRAAAPIVAKPEASDETATIRIAPESGEPRVSDETEDAPTDAVVTAQQDRQQDQTNTPTQSQVASQAQDAQVASTIGGAASRSLRPTEPPPEPPESTIAEQAAGRAARGYAAKLVEALVKLEDHLQSQTNQRVGRKRGRVELVMRLGRDGSIESLRVVQSSGNSALDRQALRDVRSFRFPTPPPLLSAQQRTFQLPITYR